MKNFRYKILSFLFIGATIIGSYQMAYAISQNPISRSNVEQRALQMINLKWTYSSAKNGSIGPAYDYAVNQPKQLQGISYGQMTGIPYTWGGSDSLDTNSFNQPWDNFLDAVAKGAYTGNLNTSAGIGHVPGTAGIDCSGFVQAAFNIKDYKISTSTMFTNYFKRIDFTNIKHMDILNQPGVHAMIFDTWATVNGVEGAYTYESTANTIHGGIQGAKRYFHTKGNVLRYIPARYIYITEDAPSYTPIPTRIPTPTPTKTPTPSPTNTPAPTKVPTPTPANIPTPVSTSTTIPKPIPYPVSTGVFAQVSNTSQGVNLRSLALTSSASLMVVPPESIIYVINYSRGWYFVNYNGNSGWIWGNYVAPLPSGKYVTTKDVFQLNLRSNPSSSGQILGVLKQGQYAKVLEYSSDGKWIKISIGNIQAWAYSQYLSYIS